MFNVVFNNLTVDFYHFFTMTSQSIHQKVEQITCVWLRTKDIYNIISIICVKKEAKEWEFAKNVFDLLSVLSLWKAFFRK